MFIIQSGNNWSCDTVIAPPGYCRQRDGQIAKERGAVSPEMGPLRLAYEFVTHRAAARVAATLAAPRIREINHSYAKGDVK